MGWHVAWNGVFLPVGMAAWQTQHSLLQQSTLVHVISRHLMLPEYSHMLLVV